MKRWLGGVMAVLAASGSAAAQASGPMGVDWGVLYGFPPAKAERFVPQARALGASFTRITLYWSQLEPRPGVMRWDDLDAWLDQLDTPESGMLTLASASPWATRTSAWVFPSSPARSEADYAAFVSRVVAHVRGRVRYFQADTEPANGFFWAGSPDEYAAEARSFHRAVKAADPRAQVVLGGSDGLFDPSGKDPLPGQQANLAGLAKILAGARDSYDLFDLHLYGDPYTIPARIAAVRTMMAAAGGGERPVIVSEYGGPGFFDFHPNRRYWAALQGPGASADAVRKLRAQPLSDDARLFLTPDDPAVAARRVRLQSEDMVVRNLLAFGAGARRTAFFDLWHDTHDADAPHTVLHGTSKLLEHNADGTLGRELPLAASFRRLAGALVDMRSVTRIAVADRPDLYAFRVERKRGPLLVAWRRPEILGQAAAPLAMTLPWHGKARAGVAIDGSAVPVARQRDGLALTLTDLPVLIG